MRKKGMKRGRPAELPAIPRNRWTTGAARRRPRLDRTGGGERAEAGPCPMPKTIIGSAMQEQRLPRPASRVGRCSEDEVSEVAGVAGV